MELTIIDLKGRFAHFRKFYTNSSSMSYSVPPRTTAAGIIAAILGLERDSYYELFSTDRMNVAVRKMNGTRNIMQTVNYIKATDNRSVLVPEEHTQIPFEMVTGNGGVCYRLYINHNDNKIMDSLFQKCKDQKPEYSPYLGAAPFGCSIKLVGRVDGKEKSDSGFVEISSIINMDHIEKGGVSIGGDDMMIMKENMPREISPGRVIGKAYPYIFDNLGKSIKVKVKGCYYNVCYGGIDENILFM